jgi:hypothetical protein
LEKAWEKRTACGVTTEVLKKVKASWDVTLCHLVVTDFSEVSPDFLFSVF